MTDVLHHPRDRATDELAGLAAEICPNAPLDLGIARAVKILLDAGIQTLESCEGGEGHAYTDPTVMFHGSVGDGWRALAACIDHGLPVTHLHRTWALTHGEVDGPYWQVVFRTTID